VVVGLAHVQGTGPRRLEDFIKFRRARLDQDQERLKRGGEEQPGDVYATQNPATALSVLPPEHGGHGFGGEAGRLRSVDGSAPRWRSSIGLG